MYSSTSSTSKKQSINLGVRAIEVHSCFKRVYTRADAWIQPSIVRRRRYRERQPLQEPMIVRFILISTSALARQTT